MLKFKKAAVIGIGLIGASLAAALKKAEAELEILAVDQNEASIEKAANLGIIDSGFTEINDNLAEAEIIFIAVPVASIAELLFEIKELSPKKQIIVDTGSTKKEVMTAAGDILQSSEKIFIGGHPMAGSHNSGIDWYNPDLFQQSPFILCPWINEEEKKRSKNQLNFNFKNLKAFNSEVKLLEKKAALKATKNLLNKIGAKIYFISAEEHDRCIAYLSHLPHLLSSALVNLSEENFFKKDLFSLAGGGYQDMTRIAGSSAELWRDILMTNSENLSILIEKYIAELKELQTNLKNNRKEEVYNFLTAAAEIKNNLKNN